MKLLLHICCAPCSIYVVNDLRTEASISIEGYFYNPNIHPFNEYIVRKNALIDYAEKVSLKINYNDDYLEDKWREYENKSRSRCDMCYYHRMEETVKYAKENGFDSYSTTLLVSPYQKHEHIKEIGYELAKKYNIFFYYKDFRHGYRKSQSEAKLLNLYTQSYCGCIVSFEQNKKTI